MIACILFVSVQIIVGATMIVVLSYTLQCADGAELATTHQGTPVCYG